MDSIETVSTIKNGIFTVSEILNFIAEHFVPEDWEIEIELIEQKYGSVDSILRFHKRKTINDL